MFSGFRNLFAKHARRRRSVRAIRIKHPPFPDLEAWCLGYAAQGRRTRPTQTLDIGCGPSPRNPFGADVVFGIDIRDDPERNVRYADLAVEPIPYPDSAFDFITAFDFIEHVPRVLYSPARRFPFVELMNEVSRTLRPGGVFLAHTPAYPFADAFQDPTHVNIITEGTFPNYFDNERQWARPYGFTGAFEIVRQGWNEAHLISILRKPG